MPRRYPPRLLRSCPAIALVVWACFGAVIAPECLSAQSRPGIALPESIVVLPTPYLDPEATLAAVEPLRAMHPERFDLHLASARAWTTLGVTDSTGMGRAAALDSAAAAARAALAVDSARADGHYWLAAALGLDSDRSGGREKISLAREAHAHTMRALELDPEHPGANHILGRLHAGTLRLSWMSRVIARALGLGAIIQEASWDDAERRMRLAAERDASHLVHHLELGKLLIARDKEKEGRAILAGLATRTPRHLLDAHYILQARARLAELDGS